MDLDLDQIYDSDAASLRTALRALDDYIAARLLPEVEIARMRRQHGLIQLELEERSANEAIIAPLGRPRPPGISSSSSTGGDMQRGLCCRHRKWSLYHRKWSLYRRRSLSPIG